MSDYAGVIAIPDYLNISDWYELVAGDSVPPEWPVLALYASGQMKYSLFKAGWSSLEVRSALARRARLFTRTPPPSAIQRIRANQTQQDELPEQADQDLETLYRRVSDLEVQLADVYAQLRALNERLNSYIDGA